MTTLVQSLATMTDSESQLTLVQSELASRHQDRWFTLAEAATALRCSPRTLFRRMAEGRLRSRFLGRHHRFTVSDLEALLSAQTRSVAKHQAEACAPA